jgi:hypothetical protein
MKKSSLLLQRPVRTFDDDPETVVQRVQPKPENLNEATPIDSMESRRTETRPITLRTSMSSETEASMKFGPLTVDLARAKKREPKGLLTTTVPSMLHGRLMQQEEGPSGFINRAVENHLRNHLNQVVEAGYRLAALRVAQAEDSRTISARASMSHVVDVDEAVSYVTQNLEKVSAAFIVGGCVMLSAEEQGLV